MKKITEKIISFVLAALTAAVFPLCAFAEAGDTYGQPVSRVVLQSGSANCSASGSAGCSVSGSADCSASATVCSAGCSASATVCSAGCSASATVCSEDCSAGCSADGTVNCSASGSAGATDGAGVCSAGCSVNGTVGGVCETAGGTADGVTTVETVGYESYGDGGYILSENISPEVMLEYADTIIDRFSVATCSFDGGATEKDIVYEGTRSMVFTGSATKSVGTELNSAQYIALAVYCENDSQITLSLSSAGGEIIYSCAAKITGGIWQTVIFDITDDIYILAETTVRKGKAKYGAITLAGTETLYVDTIIATDESELYDGRQRLLFGGDWAPYGATLTDSTLTLDNGVTGRGLKISSLPLTFGEGKGLAVIFENKSTTEALTLTYRDTESGTEYSVTESVSSIGGGQFVIFGIVQNSVDNLSITVDNSAEGSLIIYGITPCDGVTEKTYPAEILSCSVTDRENITVRAKLSEDITDGLTAGLYMFGENESFSPESLTPVATGVISGGEVTIVYTPTSVYNCLYSRFAVSVKTEGGYISSSPTYITNPEGVSGETLLVKSDTKKGSGIINSSLVTNGVGTVTVDISLSDLLSAEGGIAYSAMSYGTYSFDAESVAALDKKINSLENRSVAVIFRIYNEKTGDATLDGLIEQDEAAAFVTVASFLTDRYGITGGASSNMRGIILGKTSNGTQDKTLSECVEEYAALYRRVYTAVKSSSPNQMIYIPLTGKWFSPIYGKDISVSAFICELEKVLERDGKISWWAAYDIWNENSGSDALSEYLGAGAIQLIEKYIEEKSASGLMILGGENVGSDANSLITATAQFAKVTLYALYGGTDFITDIIPIFDASYEDTLKYVDTAEAEKKLSYLAELYSSDTDFIALLKKSAEGGRYYTEEASLEVIPSKTSDAMLIDFSDAHGFTLTDGELELKTGVTIGSKTAVTVRYGDTSPAFSGIYKKYATSIDVSYAEYLSFGFVISALDGDRSGEDVTVILGSGTKRAVFTGRVSVSGGVQFVIPVSSVPFASRLDFIGIYLSAEDRASAELCITDISVLSTKYSAKELEEKATSHKAVDVKLTYSLEKTVLLSVILAAVVTLIIVRAVRRRRG